MKKSIIVLIASTLIAGILGGCQKIKKEKVTIVNSSETLQVTKINNLSNDFYMGMDASSVISLEEGGVTYYDYDGNEADVFKVLAESGVNLIRIRVWNDPYDANGNGYGGGNCDIEKAVEIGKRATKYGMQVLIDFHYSDFWADPSKQMCPKSWKGMSIEEKSTALYEYTKDCLNKLKDAGVDVAMVQMGNETTSGMAGETIWMNVIYHLMGSSSKAIREVYPKALIAVHFANPEKVDNYYDYAKKLDYYSLDYDVFGSSYYPYWHGTLDNLSTVLSTIAEKYNKKVMVMETSYAYTAEDSDFFGNTISDSSSVVKRYPYTIQGQTNSVLDVIDTIANKTTNGIGVCYWEGTWISSGGTNYEENKNLWESYGSGWASSYAKEYDPNDAGKYYGGCAVDNQAMFDSTGHPLESLKVFALARTGNQLELKADAIEDTNISFDLNGDIILPETVNAVMNDNSKQTIPVSWEAIDEEKMKSNGVAKYTIHGTADGLEAICYVSMIEFNFLKNNDFEADANKVAVPTGWNVIDNGKENELYVEIKNTDSLTGNGHYHFWSSALDSVNFDLEQTVSDLSTGSYKFTISIMGGDGGNTNIYSYVKIDDIIVSTSPLKMTVYNEWHTTTIENIKYTAGQKITVGIHVQCQGAGAGAWGKIDCAMLNSMSK